MSLRCAAMPTLPRDNLLHIDERRLLSYNGVNHLFASESHMHTIKSIWHSIKFELDLLTKYRKKGRALWSIRTNKQIVDAIVQLQECYS